MFSTSDYRPHSSSVSLRSTASPGGSQGRFAPLYRNVKLQFAKIRRPLRGRLFVLAAAAVVALVVVVAAAVVAAVAEDQQQDDDPPPVVAREAAADPVIVVAHNPYLRFIFRKRIAYTPCYDRGGIL